MNKDLLIKMLESGMVKVQKHPKAELYIYNYTQTVQYEKIWNEVTLMTRGLILDKDFNIVSRPFGKFFNISEHDTSEIPNLPFEVYDKVDGSFGISYWLDGKPFIASRGSFNSPQANHANELLYTKYKDVIDKLDKDSTYLFEIVYPENRIVVDYGSKDELVLLSVINNKTGEERLENIGFPIVKRFDGIRSLEELRLLNDDTKEGFVIRFSNGFRLKLKFEEYVRIHRIVTGISNYSIWECLSKKQSFDELLDRVPDEFYDWVKKTEMELISKKEEILQDCISNLKTFDTRKETALYVKTQKYPSVMFNLIDGKEVDEMIWKLIKPKYSKPFSNEYQNK